MSVTEALLPEDPEAPLGRPRVSGLPHDRPRVSAETLYKVGERFAQNAFADPVLSARARAANVVLRFIYYDERWGEVEPRITVDCRQEPVKVHIGHSGLAADVVLKMHADIAHRFWMQKLNLVMAIIRGQLILKGQLQTIIRLLSIIKGCYPIYRETLHELGMMELLKYPEEKGAPTEDTPAEPPAAE